MTLAGFFKNVVKVKRTEERVRLHQETLPMPTKERSDTTLLLLSTALRTSQSSYPDQANRIRQFQSGLNAALSWALKHGVQVAWTDNTVGGVRAVPRQLRGYIQRVPADRVLFADYNSLGRKNKGAGVLTQWSWALEKLNGWGAFSRVLHFEPRQRVDSLSFFNQYLTSPGNNLFKVHLTRPRWGVRVWWPHFQTGLLGISAEDLRLFTSNTSPLDLASSGQSIERQLYLFFRSRKIPFSTSPQLGVTRFHEGREIAL